MSHSQCYQITVAQPSLESSKPDTEEAGPRGLDPFTDITSKFHLALPLASSLFRQSCLQDTYFARGCSPRLDAGRTQFSKSPESPHPSHTISTPIHRLPAELLGEIFMHCHLAEEDAQITGSRVVISHVCYRWRAIALSIPLLWTRITSRRPNKYTRDRVRAYIQRSAECPLFLSIIEPSRSNREEWKMTDDLLLELIPHHRRWKSIEFKLADHVEAMSHLPSYGFSNLEHVSFDLCRWDNQSSSGFMANFQQAPHLCAVSWCGISIPSSIPWSRLEHLNLRTRISMDDFFKLLLECKNIVEISVNNISDGLASLPPSIHLPKLAVLDITSFVNLDALFDRLITPGLQSMSIHNRQEPLASRDCRSFGQLLIRSNCQLKGFSLWDSDMSSEDLIKWLLLPPLQSLSELIIRQPAVTDTILDKLFLGSERPILLNLEAIHFGTCCSTDGMLASMVLSRNPPACGQTTGHIHRLECIEASFDSNALHTRDIACVQQFKHDRYKTNT